jgi:hypothetical protein
MRFCKINIFKNVIKVLNTSFCLRYSPPRTEKYTNKRNHFNELIHTGLVRHVSV